MSGKPWFGGNQCGLDFTVDWCAKFDDGSNSNFAAGSMFFWDLMEQLVRTVGNSALSFILSSWVG